MSVGCKGSRLDRLEKSKSKIKTYSNSLIMKESEIERERETEKQQSQGQTAKLDAEHTRQGMKRVNMLCVCC